MHALFFITSIGEEDSVWLNVKLCSFHELFRCDSYHVAGSMLGVSV